MPLAAVQLDACGNGELCLGSDAVLTTCCSTPVLLGGLITFMPPLPCALLFQGASGVGLAAIQLAKMLVRNATVFVTAGEAHVADLSVTTP